MMKLNVDGDGEDHCCCHRVGRSAVGYVCWDQELVPEKEDDSSNLEENQAERNVFFVLSFSGSTDIDASVPFFFFLIDRSKRRGW